MLRPYRNKIVLVSKCGIRFDETATTVNKPLIPDGRPETIKASIEGSLMRLNTDHLDLYYIHRIDMTVPIEETAGAMKELMEQEKSHTGGYQKPVKRLFDVHIKYARLQRFRTDIP